MQPQTSNEVDYVIVTESQSPNETGQFPSGQVGKLIRQIQDESGMDEYGFHVTTVVPNHEGGKISPGMVKEQVDRLHDEIKGLKPKVIIGLGNVALRALVGKNGIMKNRGMSGSLDGIPVVCTYHPSGIIWGRPDRYSALVQDFRMAKDLMNDNMPNTDFDWEYNVYEPRKYDLSQVVGFDVETDSKGNLLCLGLGQSPEGTLPWVQVLDRDTVHQNKESIRKVLTHSRILAHNGKFDLQVLRREGIYDGDIDEDTMLMHYALENRQGRNSLKDMATTYLYVGNYDEEVEPYISELETVDIYTVCEYNAMDVAYTLMLFDLMHKRVNKDELARRLYYSLLIPASNTLTGMEYRGVRIDTDALAELDKRYEKQLEELRFQMTTLAGREFNPNSVKQLAEVMYGDLKLPVVGKRSTNRETLQKIKQYEPHPFIDALEDYRQVGKLHSTYVKNLPDQLDENNRLHGSFNLHSTRTGRLSSSRPNLQNIPSRNTRDIRDLFVPSPGHRLMEIDFSQAEIRCLAWYSKDENLIEIFQKGLDLHTRTAALMFKKDEEDISPLERHIGKTLNFAVLYGAGPDTVVATVKGDFPEANITADDARQAIRDWFKAFPKARQWINRTEELALIDREVTTIFGRRRRFDLILPNNRGSVMRQAVNTPIQSLASDLNLATLVRIDRRLPEYPLLLTVHDSIMLEYPEDVDPVPLAYRIKGIVDEVVGFFLGTEIPFEVDFAVGDRWGSLKEMEVNYGKFTEVQ